MKDSLHYRLRACHLSCQKMIVQDLKNETNLKPGEPKILEFLAEHEPFEQKAIAHGCDLDSASVTGILRRMEDREAFFHMLDLVYRNLKKEDLF